MDFEWDESKRRENLRKHRLDFRDAAVLFESPMVIRYDSREDYGEPRWIGVGILKAVCTVVAFTERNGGETIRIISLRKALTHERKAYEKAIANRLGPS